MLLGKKKEDTDPHSTLDCFFFFLTYRASNFWLCLVGGGGGVSFDLFLINDNDGEERVLGKVSTC